MANRADDYFDFSSPEIHVRTQLLIERPGYDAVFLAPHVVFRRGGQSAGKDGWLDYQWLATLRGSSDMSGLEVLHELTQPRRYRPSSSFESYYDEFLRNSMRGLRYQIVLSSGELATGVPTSGSIANPTDPNVAFSFRSDMGDVFRIPFRALRDAIPVDNISGIIRTINPTIVAANDLMIEVPRATVDGLREAAYAMMTASLTSGDYFPSIAYKYLTVQGSDFSVVSVEPRNKTILQLSIRPMDEAVQ
jgi:hypothetical protein